jgi:hypothetical protein
MKIEWASSVSFVLSSLRRYLLPIPSSFALMVLDEDLQHPPCTDGLLKCEEHFSATKPCEIRWISSYLLCILPAETPHRLQGMREMKDARNARQYNRDKKKQLHGRHSLFSFFGSNRKKPSRATQRPVGRGVQGGRQPNRLVARPSQSRKPSGSSATSRPTASRRPTASSRSSHQSRPHYGSSRRGSQR